MILLLDPFYAILSKCEHSRPFSQEEIVEGLSYMNELLSNIPNELLRKTSEILYINKKEDFYTLDNKTYHKFIKNVEKKSKSLFPLFNKFSVYNITSISDAVILKDFLNKEEKEYIFFDIFLTHYLVYCLSLCNRVTGYKIVKLDKCGDWQEIKDVDKYLKICFALNFRLVGKQNFYNKPVESKNEIRKAIIDTVIYRIEKENLIKQMFLFDNWEMEEMKKITSALYNKFGLFDIYYCKSGGSYVLPYKAERLLIYDLDNLDPDSQTNLVKELFTGELKDSLVIIFTKTFFDLRPFPQLRCWGSAESYVGINKEIHNEIFQWSDIIESKLEEYKNVIEIISTNEQQKKKYQKKLIDYTSGKSIFDPTSVDFWYNLNSIEFCGTEKLMDWGVQVDEKYLPRKKKTKYEVRQEGNYWTIIVNDVEETDKKEKKKKQINFTKSKAIRYLFYIYKYHDVNNPIRFEDLSRSISKWKSGSEKVVKYNTFSESMVELFKKYSFLKPIDKFLYYDEKGKGCYYQKNSKIEIDLDAIEIPYIHLDNLK